MFSKKVLVMVLLGIFALAGALGETFYWIGGASGNWENGNNWSTTEDGVTAALVPGATDTAIVKASVQTNITMTSAVSVDVLSFYNLDSSGSVNQLSIPAGTIINTLYTAGNVNLDLQGDTEIKSFNIPDSNNGLRISYAQSFEVKLSGTGKLTVTDKFDLGRSSSVANTRGTLIVDSDIDITCASGNAQSHVGSTLVINEGKTVNVASDYFASSYSTSPLISIYVNGTFNIGNLFDLGRNNTACGQLTIGASGVLSARTIQWETPSYTAEGTAPFTNYGTVNISRALEVIKVKDTTELALVNNGIINFTVGGGTLSASKYEGNGTINFAGGTITAFSSTAVSSIKELNITGGALTSISGNFSVEKLTSQESSLVFDDECEIKEFNIGSASITTPVTVTFPAGKLQKIGKISSTGVSSSENIILKSDTPGSKWKVFFNSVKPVATDFSYTVVADSVSVNGSGAKAELNIPSVLSKVTDFSISPFSTENWFVYKYYWFGGTDSDWTKGANWATDSEGSDLLGVGEYPDYENNISEIVIEAGTSTASAPFMLNLGSGVNSTDPVQLKSFTVNSDQSVDFGSCRVTVTDGTTGITNDGRIRMEGSQTLSGIMKNGTDSVIEYYGAGLSSLPWDGDSAAAGKQYVNLEFSDGAGGSVSGVNVSGKTLVVNGDSNTLELSGVFGGNVVLSDSSYAAKAGEITLNSTGALTIADGAECASLTVKCPVTVESVTTTGNQDYEKAVTINGASAVLEGTALSFDGVVTLSGDATLTGTGAGTNISLNSGCSSVNGSGALTLNGDTSAASAITFNPSVILNSGKTFSSSNDVTFKKDVTFSGSISVPTVIFGGSGAQSVTSSGNTYTAVINNAAGGLTLSDAVTAASFTNNKALTASDALTVSTLTNASSISMGVNTLTFDSYSGSGSVAATTGKIISSASGSSGTIASVTFGAGEIENKNASSPLTVTSLVLNDNAGLKGGTGGITVSGASYNSKNILSEGKVTLAGGSMGNLSVKSGSCSVSAAATAGTVTVSDGSADSELTVKGFTADSVIINSKGILNGTSDTVITDKGNWSNLAGAAGFASNGAKVVFSGDAVVSGTNTFGDVTFSGGSASVTIGDSNIFGAVAFTGAGQSVTVSASNTYDSLTLSGAGSSFTFAAGETQSVTGAFTVSGTAANNISLKSGTSGSLWDISAGSNSITGVTVSDSNNTSADYFTAASSTDGGNNERWSFTGFEYKWTGAADTEWYNKANWVPESVPGLGTKATIQAVSNYPVLTANVTGDAVTYNSKAYKSIGASGTITVESGAVFDLADKNVTCSSLTNNGSIYLKGVSGQSVTGKMVNAGDNSLVEYYGTDIVSLVWDGDNGAGTAGNQFADVTFRAGSSAVLSDVISASGNLKLLGTDFSSSAANKISGTTEIETGNASLSGANIFTGEVSVTGAGNILLNGSSSGFTLSDGADCASLEVQCPVTIGNVTSTQTQEYKEDVTVSGASVLEGTTVTFGADVQTDDSLEINGNAVFNGVSSQTVNCAKALTFDGTVASTPALTLKTTGDDAHIFLKGNVTASADLIVTNSGYFHTKSGITVTASKFTQNGTGKSQLSCALTCAGGISFATDAFIYGASSFDSSTYATAFNKNIFISTASASDAVVFNSPVTVAENYALFKGALTQKADLTAGYDIILLNGTAADIYKDSESGVTDLFAYYNTNRDGTTHAAVSLAAFPASHPDGTAISSAVFDSTFAPSAGITVSAGKNFYDNGVNLTSTGLWKLNLKNNDRQADSFAELYNASVSYCNSNYALAAAESCTNGGNNTNVFFSRPKLLENNVALAKYEEKSGTYTIYDNMIRVEFVDSITNDLIKIENSGNEISKAVLNIKYANGTAAFEGTYTDTEGTVSTDGKGDLSFFYIKASDTWNTDATGSDAGNAQSTDRQGDHKTVIPDIDIPKALSGLYESLRDEHKNRIAHITASSRFDKTEDRCAPVMIAAYSGQEQHTQFSTMASDQPYYDAHNFIEFQYSEAVDISDMKSDCSDASSGLNRRADTVLGGITQSGAGLSVAGLGVIASGSLDSFARDDVSLSPHALYRNFPVTAGDTAANQSHRIRVSVAGYVDGTVTLEGAASKYWVGAIRSAASPQGAVTRAANALIHDVGTNSVVLESSGTAKHTLPALTLNSWNSRYTSSLYGIWDTWAPEIVPFISEKASWDGNWDQQESHEIIGTTTGAYLERIELHLFDNNRSVRDFYGTNWWRTKAGWNQSILPDRHGGSRAFSSGNNTSGGIRRSSLAGANAAFSYTATVDSVERPSVDVGTTDIIQTVRGTVYSRTSITQKDGPYISIPVNASDAGVLPVRTDILLKYDSSDSYITDLAGNLLSSSYKREVREFKSVDLTPPAFVMNLAPIGHNKLLAIFTKRLATILSDNPRNEYLDSLSGTEIDYAMNRIKERVTVSGNPVEKVEFYSGSNEYTALLFTLSENVTLDQVSRPLYLTATGQGDAEDSSGITVTDTGIKDYLNNYLAVNKAHVISDFALNAVNVLYGYAHSKNDDDWNEQFIYGKNTAPESSDYSLRDFSETQGNFGKLLPERDITLQVQLVEGVDSEGKLIPATQNFTLVAGKKADLTPEMVSSSINKQTGVNWRVWLPSALTSLSSAYNNRIIADNPDPSQADPLNSLLWNYDFEDSKFGFKAGDEIQFVFRSDSVTIDHDGDPSTPDIPLYALWMPEARIAAGQFNFIDLWSFKLSDITKQRGKVTVLNNVIDVSVREQTVIQVDMKDEGNLNIYIMTLDGNIVQRLSKGRTSQGTHYFRWDGTNKAGNPVARGMYFIRVTGPGIDETRKVMCVKN